jgi:hypothetical protein
MRRSRDVALLVTVATHAAVVLVIAVGALLRDTVPTGLLALGTLALGQLCPKCMAAALSRRRADGEEHEH